MAAISIHLEGEGMLKDVPRERLGHTTLPMRIGALADGMQSGKPSVAIAMFLPNGGGCVVGETSLAMFLSAADALRARYGDPRNG